MSLMLKLSQRNANLNGGCPDSQAWKSYLNCSWGSRTNKTFMPYRILWQHRTRYCLIILSNDSSFLLISHIVFLILFLSYNLITFSLSFLSPNPPVCPFLLPFKIMASFLLIVNECIRLFICKYVFLNMTY